MSNGIKLTIDDVGDVDIAAPVIDQHFEECLIDDCELAMPDYVCGHDNVRIFDHYRDPGYCPMMKWYRETKVKDYCREERERSRSEFRSKYSFILNKIEKGEE